VPHDLGAACYDCSKSTPLVARSAAAVPPLLDPIARRDDLETVYVAVMGRYIGLPRIDEVGERVSVELRVLRVGMQIGLDHQDHAKRMCEEPTFVPDICVLGVRMLNRHRAVLFLGSANMPVFGPFD
jgi:hypothetical protein